MGYLSLRSLGSPKYRWKDNINMDLKESGRVWTGFFWLRMWTSGGLLYTQIWMFGFLKGQGIC
jgi:hypothetical protein